MHVRPAALLIAAPFVLGTCAEEPPREAGRPAHLVVTETLTAMPRYTEGSISFLRVSSGSGEAIVDGPVTDGMEVRGADPLFNRELPPGTYRLVSFQRPCDGNCGLLDAPTDRCKTTVNLRPGEARTVNVVLHRSGGCTMRVR